jgi:ankyrin repeat protein
MINKRNALARFIHITNESILSKKTKEYLYKIIFANTITPLEIAVLQEDKIKVSQLIKNGANVNNITKSTEGYTTPLSLAIQKNDDSMVELLLSHGALTDLIFEFNKTVLHFAAEQANLNIVKMLLKAGANPSAKDSDGNTPLSLAKKDPNSDITRAIQHQIGLNFLLLAKNIAVAVA